MDKKDVVVFDEYQEIVTKVKKYEGNPDLYLLAKLQEETGELAKEIVKKIEKRQENQDITSELGDILWVVAAIAEDNGIKLSDVVEANVEKLHQRKLL